MNNSISLWASKNKKLARFLLVINHLCLGFIAYGVGLILSDSIGIAWWHIAALYAFTFLFYQKNNKPNSKGTLTAHLVVMSLNFCFWAMIGVKEAHWAEKDIVNNSKSVSYAKFAAYTLDNEKTIPSFENKKPSENTFFSMWKKNILRDKAFVKKYFKPDPNSDISSRITGLILLLILLTLLAIYVGWATACTIRCTGYTSGVVATIIIGIPIFILLWTAGVRKLNKLFAELKKIEAEEKRYGRQKAKENKQKKMPKTDAAPTVTVPIPAPVTPKKKEKKLSKEERKRLRNIDNSVLIVKIITVAVLAILVLTMVATSIFI